MPTRIADNYTDETIDRLESDSAPDRSKNRTIKSDSVHHPLVCFELGPMLGRYVAANPLVTVELDSTSRRVDAIGEGIDVAFRVRFPPMEDSDMTLRVLGDSAQQIVASSDLINQWPVMVAADAIHAGTIVDLLPNWRPVAGSVQANFPSRRGLLPSVRSLIEFLVTEYAARDHTQASRIHTNENK